MFVSVLQLCVCRKYLPSRWDRSLWRDHSGFRVAPVDNEMHSNSWLEVKMWICSTAGSISARICFFCRLPRPINVGRALVISVFRSFCIARRAEKKKCTSRNLENLYREAPVIHEEGYEIYAVKMIMTTQWLSWNLKDSAKFVRNMPIYSPENMH